MKWRLIKGRELEREQVQELKLHKEKMLRKHETMKDDIYRKRFDYSAQEERKLPTWALVMICCMSFSLYILIFHP